MPGRTACEARCGSTVFNDDSDVLLGCGEVTSSKCRDGKEHEVSVDAVRKADKALLMKLHSVDDRDRADELRGAQIGLKRGDLPPLGEGEFYFCDVEGAEVRLGEERVGVVERVVEYPTVTALVVRQDDGKELEVPLAGRPCVPRVDAGSHVVHVEDQLPKACSVIVQLVTLFPALERNT